MKWINPDISYWDKKFAAYWHDPIDKVFNIQGHEQWSADYLQAFGFDRPNDEFWKKADAIAAGFERGQVPSYHADRFKNGSVDFAAFPVLSHPTADKNGQLKITGNMMQAGDIHQEAVEFLKKTIGMTANKGDYAARFEEDPERFAVARLLFSHLVLRFHLGEKNIGGLGALWHRLPADSRFPDHSVWQHNALCSAIGSCIELGGTVENVGLLVFSITPVQGFIARARKMRDLWGSSVLLSWLAFEGLRWVIENLGADHVLYPSLVDQPLVNFYLEKDWAVSGAFKPSLWTSQPSEIASLPNKFLFLVPFSKVETIASEIKQAIAKQWEGVSSLTTSFLREKKNLDFEEAKFISSIFERQTSHYWEYHWAAARMADIQDKDELESLLTKDQMEGAFGYFKAIKQILESKSYPLQDVSRGVLYSLSHRLAQTALAADKQRRSVIRAQEPGEKCQMCGEFEVLHAKDSSRANAKVYKENIKEFWRHFENDSDFNEYERLCAICFIKRYAPRVLRKNKNHILNSVFRDTDSFPSTTMMALFDYYRRNKITDEKKKQEIADNLHNSKTDDIPLKQRIRNQDKYYAILMMDGDHMGRLVNGETIASTWQKIMHPEIVERMCGDGFDPLYKNAWRGICDDAKLNKRLVTPAIHAAISEALGDFSIYGVASIIDRFNGRLIYAGGDDVCAFLPMRSALPAAREIADYYTSAFRLIRADRTSTEIKNEWRPSPGKLSVNLGFGANISISAAVLICHHKESLSQMLERSRQLLKTEAKDKAGRNACAIELRKRHGGSRIFVQKWTSREKWEAFDAICKLTGQGERQLAHSVLYRLEELRPGITAIINRKINVYDNMKKFISTQLSRSGTGAKAATAAKLPEWLVDIVLDADTAEETFNPEGLLIAGFIGGEEKP